MKRRFVILKTLAADRCLLGSLNRFNDYFIDSQVYGYSLRSVRNNVSTKWIVDTDPFSVNQFLHSYRGSVYFGLARSSGLDYWESMAYTFGDHKFGAVEWRPANGQCVF